MLSKLARLPLSWFQRTGPGKVKNLIQDESLNLHYLVTHAVTDAVAAIVAPVAVLVYLFAVDWRIALLLFVPVLVYIVAMYTMLVQSGDKTVRAMAWSETMSSEAEAFLHAQLVIRVFGGSTDSKFMTSVKQYRQFLNDWQQPFVRPKTLMDVTTRPSTFLLLIMLIGTILISTGGMDPINLLPFLLLGTTFGARLLGIGYGMSGLREGIQAARNIQNTLDERELQQSEKSDVKAHDVSRGTVRCDKVSFEYHSGVPVLQDINLELKPGTRTALVGSSGSGKSTLGSLLARFQDVSEGRIELALDDGVRDIRSLSSEELYGNIGFVFQDVQLVNGTVAENIALAVPDADQQLIEQAAQQAQIHERILSLPLAYDTPLDGTTILSGGEKQRIAIARAILADTPILILDEATAFADPESEFLLQRALSHITRERTVLIIAHRLNTISDVDNIVVLEQGEIRESGTHEELLKKVDVTKSCGNSQRHIRMSRSNDDPYAVVIID